MKVSSSNIGPETGYLKRLLSPSGRIRPLSLPTESFPIHDLFITLLFNFSAFLPVFLQCFLLYAQLLLHACRQELHESSPSATGNCGLSYSDASAAVSSFALSTSYRHVSIWFGVLLNGVLSVRIVCEMWCRCKVSQTISSYVSVEHSPSTRSIRAFINELIKEVRFTGSLLNNKPTRKRHVRIEEAGARLRHRKYCDTLNKRPISRKRQQPQLRSS